MSTYKLSARPRERRAPPRPVRPWEPPPAPSPPPPFGRFEPFRPSRHGRADALPHPPFSQHSNVDRPPSERGIHSAAPRPRPLRIPTGFRPKAQGCEVTPFPPSYLGSPAANISQPQRGCGPGARSTASASPAFSAPLASAAAASNLWSLESLTSPQLSHWTFEFHPGLKARPIKAQGEALGTQPHNSPRGL